MATIEVRDGSWTSPEGPEYGSMEGVDTKFGDVTGDGREDALVNLYCTTGAGGYGWATTVVMEAVPGGVAQVGQAIPATTYFIDGQLIGEVPYFEDSDSSCCPSSIDQSRWVLRNGGWSEEGGERVPSDFSYGWGE
jgi:hypothetical protein